MVLAPYFYILLDWHLFNNGSQSLPEKCPYSELFWSVFSPNDIYNDENNENKDQNNFEQRQFLRSDSLHTWYYFTVFFFYNFMFDVYLLHMFCMIKNWEKQVILIAKNEIFPQLLLIILGKKIFMF